MFSQLKFSILVVFFLVVLGGFFYLKHLQNKLYQLNQQKHEFKTNYEKTKLELTLCQTNYQEILKKIELQQDEYNKRISTLLRKVKTAHKITIPQFVEKNIVISQEDCKKLTSIIDEYIRVEKEQ